MTNNYPLEYDWDDEEYDDYYGFNDVRDFEWCPVCHGTGLGWDGFGECENCDGEGYLWWLDR